MHSTSSLGSALAWQVDKLRASDIAATAKVLAAAFADNPAYAFMHPRVRRRAADLTAFFERNLSWHLPLDLTWVARTASGEPIGTATLEPPQGLERPASETFSHWLWPTLRDQGLHTVSRIIRADAEFRHHSREVAADSPYFHVHAVAVAPSWQRKGVGVALLRELLKAVPSRTASPVVLSTQRERNLHFYAQFGFVVCKRVRMGRGLTSPGFDSWFMRAGAPSLDVW